MWARHQCEQWSKESEVDEKKQSSKIPPSSAESSSTSSSSSLTTSSRDPDTQLWIAQKTQTVKNISYLMEAVKKTFSS